MTPVTQPPPPLAVVATNTATPAVLSLQPGVALNAQVLARLDATTLRLLLGDATLDLNTDLQLAPGTKVALAVEGSLSQPKLTLRLLPTPAAQPGSQALPQVAPQAALRVPPALNATAAATAGNVAPRQSAPVTASSQTTIPGRPLPSQIATAATRLELAVEGTPTRPKLVLRPLPEISGGATPQSAPRAPALAPSLSHASAVAAAVKPATLPSVAAISQPSPATAAIEAAVRSAAALVGNAAARQGGLAPLYANLEAALARADLPPPVVAAARQLLALRLDVSTEVDADGIKNALLRSGLVADSTIAGGVPSTTSPGDLRSALLVLRETLRGWASTELLAPKDSLLPSPPVGEPHAAARGPGPALPLRNGPTLPQPIVPATIATDMMPAELARQLLDETDAAIARQTLLQIASLPDDLAGGVKPRGEAASQLTFDIPLVNGQGTAIAQMRIERDGAERSADGDVPIWRVSFSIDLEPIGPVHARIGLIGERATVTLKAERSDSANRLARELPLLEAGLRSAELEPGRLLCHTGAPQGVSAEPGHFLDQAS
jgi:Flagellar hook-length control protein FliK